MPPKMARLVGAPIVMASHVGPITMSTPALPGVPYRTQMVGQTQICERDGTVLARLDYDDGEGHIAATVELAPPDPLDEIPSRFWFLNMGPSVTATWSLANVHGTTKYHALKRLGRHPWQRTEQART